MTRRPDIFRPSRRVCGTTPLSQRGLSLIELMVAMAIGLVMLATLASLYASNSKTHNEFSKTSAQVENGRFAIQSIEQDVAQSGFYGRASLVASSPSYIDPDPCATAKTLLGFSASPTLTLPNGVVGMVYGAAVPSCLSSYNVAPNSEILIVRYASGDASASVDTTNYFLQLSQCSQDLAPLAFDTAASAFTLQTLACNGTKAEIRKYVERIYFLSTCDTCTPNSDNIPTLKVAELSNGALVVSSLVQGIQDIHYSYGIDRDQNGSPDCYVDDPTIDNTANCGTISPTYSWVNPVTNWYNVTAVRVSVLARNVDPTVGWTDTRSYSIGRTVVDGGAVADGPYNDTYKRHVYTTLARVWNTGGLREMQ
ncbi:PilW family protein [Dyella telluris]|uniref:PilW family protein n=1 Tax=Dyella telluris TaxID=2763498 RepID=A0A7G8Q0P1_9GAMM|nr:PilW family protein [Dyella telluris]QNK00349.1 PilW family protein [Dyella telluris]